jgi:hypothetical protein
MRTSIGLVALLVGLAIVSECPAQLFGFGNSRSQQKTRLSAANQTGFIGPTSYLGSPFRLRDLFPSLRSTFSNRNPVGRSTIPDPNSPEYLKAFGFKKLF